MQLRSLSLLSVFLVMTGCGTLTTPLKVSQPIPANLTTPCPPLPKLADKKIDTVIETLIEVAGMYHECAAGKAGLAAAVKNREKQ